MSEFPAEMKTWTARCEWLLRDFVSTSKNTKMSLNDVFKVGNGDSTQPVITHWCLSSKGPGKGPCCNSDEEALLKFISHAVHFFGKGFDTPLLYRLKHFGPASSFVKAGTCYFNLLPQILKEMDTTAARESQQEAGQFVDSILADNVQDGDWQHVLADALDHDKNFVLQNGARRRMVADELNKPNFYKSSMTIDSIIGPMEYGINFLFGHTKLLHDLSYLGRCHSESEQLQEKARCIFFHVIFGNLGGDLIKRYVTFLDTGLLECIKMGLSPSCSQLNTIFNVVLVIMSDICRRLQQVFDVPPFTLFKLCEISDTGDFVKAFSDLDVRFQTCAQCFDFEFSSELMAHFAVRLQSNHSAESQEAAKLEMQTILRDVAAWCPVSSDLVEVKNGQVQWAVSKRGSQNVLGGPSAYETTLIQSAVKQHKWVQDRIAEQSLPPKAVAAGILKMCGSRSSNQFSGEALASVKTNRSTQSFVLGLVW